MFPVRPPHDMASLLALDRARLLDVASTLSADDWARPTRCPGWSVQDLFAHLVGDDLSVLARHRDGHGGPTPPDGADEAAFIAWLDELQDGWVIAARRCSPPLLVQLLGWLTDPLVAYVEADDGAAVTAHVSWASDSPTPRWLDHGRELTERWIHRQQVLEAVGRDTDLRSDLCRPVLDVLRWAYPYRLAAHPAGAGDWVEIASDPPGPTWWFQHSGGAWQLVPSRPAGQPRARLGASLDQLWRLLTNNFVAGEHGRLQLDGDEGLITVLLSTRAIIGEPRPNER